jgi:hypothetical protein
MRTVLLLALAAALTTGCARRAQTAEPSGAMGTERTTVRVENRSFADMTIYVLRGAERIRLGTATGSATTVLEIPGTVVTIPTLLRFLADPIGSSRTPVSEEINVRPGDEVTLMIPPP